MGNWRRPETGQGLSLLALVGQFFLFGVAFLLPLSDLGIEIAALVREAVARSSALACNWVCCACNW